MSNSSQATSLQRWFISTLILGLGGAALIFAAFALSNAVYGATGRVIEPDTKTGATLIVAGSLVVVGLVGHFLARRRWTGGQSCMIVIMWWAAYFILMVVGIVSKGLSLPVYLALCLGVGACIALLLQASPGARLAGTAAMAAAGVGAYSVANPKHHDVIRRSEFGRLPAATVVLLTQHVRTAVRATQSLPANVPLPIRNAAVSIVLDHVLRDWWENGNREGLTPTDIADMEHFVQLAWSQLAALPSLPEATAVFSAVLKGLMGDWFNSWNANGVDGAPRWQWEQAR